MKPLSRSILVFSFCLLLVLPKKIAQACGFYIWPGEYRFWLLQPDLTNQRDLSPFFLATTAFYPDDQPETIPPYYQQNIQEWLTLMGNKTNERDIEAILYNTSPDDFLNGINQLANTNSFAALLKQPQNRPYLRYMKLAKKVEAYAVNPDPWREDRFPDATLDRLIEEANKLYATTSNKPIRLRIAYQLMRMHGYNAEPTLVNKTWYEKVASVKTNSYIKYAALYERAIHADGPENYYLLSLVFDQSTFNRQHCLTRFGSPSLKEILPLATSDHERTVLYAMRAFRDRGRTLHAIKLIYSREPDYKELSFLLLREINKTEDWLLTNKVTGFEPAMYSRFIADDEDIAGNLKRDIAYTRHLYDFVKLMLAERKNKDRALLYTYAAHLAFMQGLTTESRQYLDLAARSANLPANVKTQLRVHDLLLSLEKDPSFGKATENKLMKLLLTPSNKLGVHSPEIMKDQLILYTGRKLLQNGQRGKGLLLLGKTRRALGELSINTYKTVYELMWETATARDYDEMLQMLSRKRPSVFEQFVTKGNIRSPWSYQEWSRDYDSVGWNWNKLVDLKAGWYIRQDSLEKALTVLKQIPAAFWKEYPYDPYISGDPFYLNINHPRTPESHEKNYNKPQVVEAMIQLKKKAVQDKKNAALYNYKLANAYYNLTWHGKLWIMSKPWSSCSEFSSYSDDHSVSRFNDVYYGCDRAKEYYVKALRQTTDKKLASLCAFMARHCEQNFQEYRALRVFKRSAAKIPDPYPKWLQQKGFGGDFYQELIEECATYNSFVRQIN